MTEAVGMFGSQQDAITARANDPANGDLLLVSLVGRVDDEASTVVHLFSRGTSFDTLGFFGKAIRMAREEGALKLSIENIRVHSFNGFSGLPRFEVESYLKIPNESCAIPDSWHELLRPQVLEEQKGMIYQFIFDLGHPSRRLPHQSRITIRGDSPPSLRPVCEKLAADLHSTDVEVRRQLQFVRGFRVECTYHDGARGSQCVFKADRETVVDELGTYGGES